ncbi:MAG: M48 family metallopeptidase [Spirosomaceae bacterium]|nr:M48 family metallopeptidase [Spirosomataceae bacterium]
MKKYQKLLLVAFAFSFTIFACQKVPLTGRSQFVGLMSQDAMLQMAFTEYKSFVDTSKVVPVRNRDAEMVTRVGTRIKTAVETYLIQNGFSKEIDGYQWEFTTVDNSQINAWAMPGGKVCFYTGILPICRDDAGVAVVMGHEIAHAIASHGRERMSRSIAAQGITQVGAVLAGIATGDERMVQTAGQVLGLLAPTTLVLPNSRNQESEADKLGTIFMAMAGYDPREAVGFWQRMAEAGKGQQKPPMLLSTHPSDEKRIADLETMMPKALKYYQAYGGK